MYGHLVYYVVIWYNLDMLHQEKSGNPVRHDGGGRAALQVQIKMLFKWSLKAEGQR
jgi:hypothetical protein